MITPNFHATNSAIALHIAKILTARAVFGARVAIALTQDKDIQRLARAAAARTLGLSVWVIALVTLGIINGAANSLQLGRDARGWCDRNHASEVIEDALIRLSAIASVLVPSCSAKFLVQPMAIAPVLGRATKTELMVIIRDLPSATDLLCDRATAGIRWVLALA